MPRRPPEGGRLAKAYQVAGAPSRLLRVNFGLLPAANAANSPRPGNSVRFRRIGRYESISALMSGFENPNVGLSVGFECYPKNQAKILLRIRILTEGDGLSLAKLFQAWSTLFKAQSAPQVVT